MNVSLLAAVVLDAAAEGVLLELPREPVTALAGETLVVETAGPGDGTPVVRGALLVPPGAGFDAASGRFTWTPETAQAGEHRLELWAVSGTASEAASLAIVVETIDPQGDIPITYGGCDCQRVPEPGGEPDSGAASLAVGALGAVLASRRRLLGP